jgi:MYXO-CTERM domain-containing protein
VNDGTASCSYLNIATQPRTAKEVGKDFTNVLKFRDTKWCRPARGNDPERCYASSAAGVTNVLFVDDAKSSRDGAIVDADIELNGVDFAISNAGATLGKETCLSDLKNTLTHELGHFLGLEHTCLAPADPARLDDKGQPVPGCSGTSLPAIVESTMYNYEDCGETKKASLSPDDIAAICAVYPIAKDPGVCNAVNSTKGGCCQAQATGSGTQWPWLLAMWGLLAMVTGRRRR